MNSFACLFDIDGVLTLPLTEKRTISVFDHHAIKLISVLRQRNIPVSLITGRAYPWIQMFLLKEYQSILKDIPIFMEYGLTSYINGIFKISKKAKNFRDDFFFPLLASIKQTCQENNIFFELTPSIDYPMHGSLWVEEKNGMISIISNKLISTSNVYKLVETSVQEYIASIRLLKHHLGFDILPKGWSKEQAAIEASKILDPAKKVEKWFVFGDNESDREMCKPFTSVEFIDTKIGASETTIKFLKENLLS